MRGVQAEERLAVSSPRRNNLVNHTMLQPRISVVMKVDTACTTGGACNNSSISCAPPVPSR